MKQYSALTCRADRATLGILSALGETLPITGIVENNASITYFFNEGVLDDAMIDSIRAWVPEGAYAEFERETVEEQNWNAEFEASLTPVRIAENLVITQSWNPVEPNSDDDLVVVIDPKMSFGTGHHESTRLIATLMCKLDFSGRRVLDVGTGTGLLAIIAHRRGAAYTEAIDNNEWAVENTRENVAVNDSSQIIVSLGELDDVVADDFDMILANIHRNVIIELLPGMISRLSDRPGSSLLTSGVLIEDHPSLVEIASQYGLRQVDEERENEWIAARFQLA